MPTTTSDLLKKVKASIQLRIKKPESYRSSFKNPKSFITATVRGQQEFVPISLLYKHYGYYQILVDLFEIFGKPILNAKLDLRLKFFYKEHGLKWKNNDNITYYIKPISPPFAQAFFSTETIEKLSNYAGSRYKVSDAFLRDLGNTFFSEIVDRTNDWARALTLPMGYIIEPERYWQVAGRFKSFTWAKIYKEEFKKHKIFFSVGVDLQNKKIILQLDGLRSGTHKLSNFEIRTFDYFTQSHELKITFDWEKIEFLSLDTLILITNRFIERNKKIYEQTINLIWFNLAETDQFSNLLLKMPTPYTSKKKANLDKISNKKIAQLIINYEKYILLHARKKILAQSVCLIKEGKMQLIKSFETNGKPKTILFKASTGGMDLNFKISCEELDFLSTDLCACLYQIVEYNVENNCGKLIVRTGDPTRYAKLKSIKYEVVVN